MTEAKYVGNISRVMYDNWTDFVPTYHSYYDSYMRLKKFRKQKTRQKRIFLAILMSAVVLACVFFTSFNTMGSESTNAVMYSVSAGDTLWSIARTYKPDGVSMDEYLYKLKKANSMTESNINIGDIIIIP